MDKWKSLRAQFRYHYKKRDSFVDWKYAQDMAFLEQHIRWGRKSISFNQSNRHTHTLNVISHIASCNDKKMAHNYHYVHSHYITKKKFMFCMNK